MDIMKLAQEINQSAGSFMALISRFNNEQLNTIPFKGSWTAGQVADHIIKATDGLPDNDTKPVDRIPDKHVEGIKSVFLDFTVKFVSPNFIIPGNGPFETNLILRELLRIKKQNVAAATTKDASAICLDFELPGFGYLTRYEWLQFSVYHTQRHTQQLEKIAEKILILQT